MAMSHMKKETYKGAYYEVETTQGTWFVPEEVSGCIEGMTIGETWYEDAGETEDEHRTWADAVSILEDFVEAGPSTIVSIGKRVGTLYRLSAPGYLDCTDWTTDESGLHDDTDL